MTLVAVLFFVIGALSGYVAGRRRPSHSDSLIFNERHVPTARAIRAMRRNRADLRAVLDPNAKRQLIPRA